MYSNPGALLKNCKRGIANQPIMKIKLNHKRRKRGKGELRIHEASGGEACL